MIASPKSLVIAGAMAFGLLVLYFLMSLMSGPSHADVALYESQCVRFIKDQFEADDAFANGNWIKDGQVVIEVGYRDDSSDSSFYTRLCVIDADRGQLVSPGAFDRARWEP